MLRISRTATNVPILPVFSRYLDVYNKESERQIVNGRFFEHPYARLVTLHGQRLAGATQNDYFVFVPNTTISRGLYQRWQVLLDNPGIADIPPGYYRLDYQGYDEEVEYSLGAVVKASDQSVVDAPGGSNTPTTTLASFFCYVEERYPHEIQEGAKFGLGDTEPAYVVPVRNGFE